MKKLILTLTVAAFAGTSFAQKAAVHGTITDAESGETMISATVVCIDLNIGAATNTYGFYSISLPKGRHTLVFSYLGYCSITKEIDVQADMRLDMRLQESANEIEEVVVSGEKSVREMPSTSITRIQPKRIGMVASALGEPDLLKTLQLMPGIQAVNEGASNLYVRGGSYDQNLFLLDEAPVYNPTHALGFFSTFNADILKSTTVYKGVYPVQFGGRLSSVVDINMREGDMNRFHTTANLGLTASGLTLEGPIAKGKASFIVAGRSSYIGLYMKAIDNADDKINFYDLNAKLNWNVNSRNHVYLSAYTGADQFLCFALNKNNLEWGNTTGTLRWNHIFSGKLFSNLTLYGSQYNYKYSIWEDVRRFDWTAQIQELGLKYDLSHHLGGSSLKYGLAAVYHYFEPGMVSPQDETSITREYELDHHRAVELSVYVGNNHNLTNSLSADYGLRFTAFTNIGAATTYNYNSLGMVSDSTVYGNGETINTYGGLEPRLSLKYDIDSRNTVKLSYAFTRQYMHLLSNSTVGLPTDVWVAPDEHLKPQESNQFVAGFYHLLSDLGVELSAEVYYKTMNNLVDYKDNADLFMNKHLATQLLHGKGYSYGLELLAERRSGRLSGWIGYTLAKTQYKIDGVNQNRYYSPRYDIRHNLSLTGSFELTRAWTVSSTFKLTSGGFVTIPDQIYEFNGCTFFDYSCRNNYELPTYHRLDLAAIYRNPKNDTRKFDSQWMFSLYNVYGRKNVYSLYVKQDKENITESHAYKMYLYRIVPSISYKVKF